MNELILKTKCYRTTRLAQAVCNVATGLGQRSIAVKNIAPRWANGLGTTTDS